MPAVLYHRALGGEKLSNLLGSRYVLHELLARGSMGYVFRGSARADGYPVQGSGVFRTYPVLGSMRWQGGIARVVGHGHAT